MHLKNIFDEGELKEEATCKDFLQVQHEGNRSVNLKAPFLRYLSYNYEQIAKKELGSDYQVLEVANKRTP